MSVILACHTLSTNFFLTVKPMSRSTNSLFHVLMILKPEYSHGIGLLHCSLHAQKSMLVSRGISQVSATSVCHMKVELHTHTHSRLEKAQLHYFLL